MHAVQHLAMVDGTGSVSAVWQFGIWRFKVVQKDDLREVQVNHASKNLVAHEGMHGGDGTIPPLTPAAKYP